MSEPPLPEVKRPVHLVCLVEVSVVERRLQLGFHAEKTTSALSDPDAGRGRGAGGGHPMIFSHGLSLTGD